MTQNFPRSAIGIAVLALLCAPAFAQDAPAQGNAVPNGAAHAQTQTLSTVEVTSERFKKARMELSPETGATVYRIDQSAIGALGKGDATPLDDVLLTLPGVAKDSKASGSLHVRDDHGNVQYRINGVQLPEGISGFGQTLDTRYIDAITYLTGALPAQYGLRTAGVVDIQTKQGFGKPGGSLGFTIGSHDTLEGSGSVYGTKGNLSYYLSASGVGNSQGIENPQPTLNAQNDRTRQGKTFGNFSYYLDDDTRLGLMFGSYDGKFQIPTNPNQTPAFSLAGFSDLGSGYNGLPSSNVRERQNESTRFVALSYQKSLGALDFQLSAFHQYSSLHYLPDPVGDLIYNGVASDTLRSNSSSGLQGDASYKLNDAHTLRFGGLYTRANTRSNNAVNVFPVDDSGAQAGNTPVLINDNSGKTGELASLYLQDEWRIDPRLTFNYGLRYDSVNAFTKEHQWSPRLNLAYAATESTALHAGFARYFTPPPQELASQQSINLYTGTTNQPEVANSDPVKAERSRYFDVGVDQKVGEHLSLSADAYYKHIDNLLDEGQFGQALILSPFNYAQGFARGLELSARYSDDHWAAYANLAHQKAMGKNIVSSQSLFGADELSYIADHYVYLDHDQTYTASLGASYRFGADQVSGDLIYGSGLRRTPDGGAPNSAALPHYTVVNAAYSHTWKYGDGNDVVGRIAVLNLFDEKYLLRDGTGVGVGAPQYGTRRSLYVSMTTHF
ncbi:outer membrane receptor protein involved in Fe transport [Pseudacidovorax intermedius]|uniref:Outer membrane receptor protein involved in Fe transport n=2 Tax=Pseudacidovorax intermedius TaxID=433924 RepID=A0A370F6L1_9BURK|nr:TonB-dependent receptor [Pseudacidovorax intermedius]RDI19615.1 outer membrane receptor protein involved in Fe transport [Pseudacidovorax intermedius]